MATWFRRIRSGFEEIQVPERSRTRPKMIANFAVTYRCDSHCRTCNIWRIEGPERDELTLEEVRGLYESNREFLSDVGYIQITGGEPFLRPDLPEIVSVIHETLPRCVLGAPTNGMEPDRIERATETIIECLGGQGFGVVVSIDGLERTHDTIRGVDGSFRKAVETLRRLTALVDRYPGLRVVVGMTLTSENYDELLEVFLLARKYGARFSFRPINYSDIYYRNARDELSMREAAGELLPAIQRLGRAVVERYGISAAAPTLCYYQGAIDYIRNPLKRWLRCSAATDSMFLDPYGNVYPCIFMDEKMGNIREAPMGKIWGSKEASVARLRIMNGECPGCWVECEAFRDIHKDPKRLASSALRALLHPKTAGIR
ncbi:MAG: radical SAM protein [Candidatus Bathyarchaeota archaeon]|nr:MAG: radical SAM protein [Candidatus Bathyarchaeota archaeon]